MTHPDELRLSAGLEGRIAAHFKLVDRETDPGSSGPVDVAATNSQAVLAGATLADYVPVPPGSPLLTQIDRHDRPLAADQLCVLLLAGGMSFRSGGAIHPLLPVGSPPRSLLCRQLDRLSRSPVAAARTLVVGSPFNVTDLRLHLSSMPEGERPRVYGGGLAPRLAVRQRLGTPPAAAGEAAYNPAGHFEALRWLVLTGLLGEVAPCSVIVTLSYSNWGDVFSEDTLRIAGMVPDLAAAAEAFLFLAEVCEQPATKKTGSFLVTHPCQPGSLRLIKRTYGSGVLASPQSGGMLTSANTLHFSTANLLRRLRAECEDLDLLLSEAAAGRDRDRLSDVFDAAFPIKPQVIRTHTEKDGENEEFLRIERDLDQLSLLPEAGVLQAVRVDESRAVSIKLPADLEDPAKRALVLGSRP